MAEKLFYKDNLDELQHLFKKGKPFVLFLGAGVNGDFENMLWTHLLNYLLDSSLKILSLEEGIDSVEKETLRNLISEKEGKFSAYHKAMFIKKVLGDNYIGYLQSYIYSNCNKQVIKELLTQKSKSIFLFEIAKLILNKENIHAVVTYNYDNFLTETVKLINDSKVRNKRQIECIDIYRSVQKMSHENGKFPVYHVHGFIPPPDGILLQEPENIVLSMDEYFNNMIRPFSWQTTTQLYFLNNYNCLFLGASLDDWNMLRALSYSNHFSKATKHFVIFRNEEFKEGTRVATFMNRVKASIFEDIGIKTIYTRTQVFKEIHSIISNLKKD